MNLLISSPLLYIREKLEKAWSPETAFAGSKNIYYPAPDKATGQCAVSALVVQQLLGGEIYTGFVIVSKNRKVRHYWNRIGELDIDLTWRQFEAGAMIVQDSIKKTSRSQLMRNESTKERYFKLYNKANGF
jgi:hypothetical protein